MARRVNGLSQLEGPVRESFMEVLLSELLVLIRCRGNSEGMNQYARTLTWCLILLQVD